MTFDSAYISSITSTGSINIPKSIVVLANDSNPNEWDEDGGIVHIINEENFFFLEKVENTPCSFKIQLSDSSIRITNISVVSEGRLIEIYGKYGEYLKTCKCEYISEVDGRKFYASQTDLLTTHEVSINFPGIKGGLWLCGIKLLLKDAPPPITSSFDYNLVDDKLKKSNIPITEKAEQFKKFLHDYAASKYPSTNIDPHKFLKIVEGECMSHLRPVEAAGRNISKYLSNFIPSLKGDEKESKDDTISDVDFDQDKPQSSMRDYVDERIQKLEERLEENFTKQLKELESRQNEKLDSILALLKTTTLN